MEQAEKFELFDKPLEIDRSVPSFSSYYHSTMVKKTGKEEDKEKEGRHLSKEISNYQLTKKAVDVFGKEVEPICDYLRCHHKLSVHGLSSSKCRCKQPSKLCDWSIIKR